MNVRQIYLNILLFVFLMGSCQLKLLAELGENFEKLTQEEKSSLRSLFDEAIKKDHLGHVLFFSTKPACLFVIDTDENTQVLFAEAWKIWKKKEPLFQHPNFIVCEEVSGNRSYVYFINKQTLLSQLSNKEEYLRQIFGKSFSIKVLIENLEQKTFPSFICKNHALLGILLGYGIESPLGYKQYISPDPRDSSRKELTGILCAADGKIETTETEDSVTLCKFNSKAAIHPVAFIGDPKSEEVKNLKEIYSQELEKIEVIYENSDLLRICLEKLCHSGVD